MTEKAIVCSCGRDFKTKAGLLSHLRANRDHYNATIGPSISEMYANLRRELPSIQHSFTNEKEMRRVKLGARADQGITPIWDEKPTQYHLFGNAYYDITEIDAWLEKLKKYYEMKDYMDKKIMLSTMIDVDNKLEAIKEYADALSRKAYRPLKNIGLKLLEILQGCIIQKLDEEVSD